MSMDPLPVYLSANRWKHADLLHLPRTQIEPVIWIDAEDRLAMYHPVRHLDVTSPPKPWSHEEFMSMVAKILPEACDIIERDIIALGVPQGFFSSYPEHARVGMSMEM